METRKERTKTNTRKLAVWTTGWLLSMALVSFGAPILWPGNHTLSLILIIFNALIGIGMILANIRHLKGLDELDQKITMDAMAIALGVGVVGGLTYSLMDITNVISSDAEIGFLVMLIGITYLISMVVGKMRYQ